MPTDGPADHDEERMALASALAAHARRRTAPNPWVGCVVERDGVVVGQGTTEPPGGPHAEVTALRAAGDRAVGATMYVTLEPCAHQGRTPPCADAVAEVGVRRVVVALEDPDPRVAGEGIARLRAAGVSVDVGIGAVAAGLQLAPYLHHRRTGRAYCVVKTALSLDGRSAAADGSSRWITGSAARADAHELRADSQAIVVGAGTAIADDPALTVRLAGAPPANPPLRVLVDAAGRVPATGRLFDADAPTMVITTERAPRGAHDAWRAAGAKVEVVDGVGGRVDLRAALETLGSHGVLQAMVEGGPAIQGALVEAGLVDRYVVYVGAALLGSRARPAFEWPGPASIGGATRLRMLDCRVLGDDVRIDYADAREVP